MTECKDGASRRGLLQGAALVAALSPAIADARTPRHSEMQRAVDRIK